MIFLKFLINCNSFLYQPLIRISDRKINFNRIDDWLIDWFIWPVLTRLDLFYAYRLGNCFYCTFLSTILLYLLLKYGEYYMPRKARFYSYVLYKNKPYLNSSVEMVTAFEERDERLIRATKFIYNNNNNKQGFYTKWNKQRIKRVHKRGFKEEFKM